MNLSLLQRKTLRSKKCNNLSKKDDALMPGLESGVSVSKVQKLKDGLLKDHFNDEIKEINGLRQKPKLFKMIKSLTSKVSSLAESQKEIEKKLNEMTSSNEILGVKNESMISEVHKKTDYNKKLESLLLFIIEIFVQKNPRFNMKGQGNFDKQILFQLRSLKEAYQEWSLRAIISVVKHLRIKSFH